MARFWPGASLRWPVCERALLTAAMPPGQQLPFGLGGIPAGPSVFGPGFVPGYRPCTPCEWNF